MKRTDLPDWPRGLSRDDAAIYVGVGTTLFDEMVKDGRMPQPAPPDRFNARVVWDRRKLDMALDALFETDGKNPFDKLLA